MNAITEATEAVETMPPLREVAPLSLFVQSERNFSDDRTTYDQR